MTAGAIDLGEKPSVVSAIAKYHVTERARQVVNDGMDVVGGKGICLGPSNFLGRAYQQMPIGITVEGANILTRSLIIFGQGRSAAIPTCCPKCTPRNRMRGRAWSISTARGAYRLHRSSPNASAPCGMGMTGSHFVGVPDVAPETRRYYQQLTRLLGGLRLLADISMLVLGGASSVGKAVGAARRHPVADVPDLGTLKRLRGRRAARPPTPLADALGDLGCHVPRRRRRSMASSPISREPSCHRRLPASWSSLGHPMSCPRTTSATGGQAADRAVRPATA